MLVQQLGAMVVGRWYEITFTVSAWVSGSLKSDNFVQAGLTLASGVGVYKVIGLSSSTTFAFLRASANVDLTIDSISVREVLGNHAYQTTTTSRPTLSARYNLFANTEDASAWTKTRGDTGTSPVVTPDAAVAPNGTLSADRCVMSRGSGTTSAAYSLVYQSASHSVATVSLRSVWMRSFTGANQTVLLYDGSQAIGRVVTVTPAWQQFFLTGGTAAAVSSLVIGTRGGDPGTYYASGGDPNLDILIWGMDLRAASDGVGLPPYQRVVDANTYDTAGFPLYLQFDGVDDFLQTASVDFSGTDKLFASAALRKLSDAAAGIVVELSLVSNSNPGAFALLAPSGTNPTLGVYLRGATTVITNIPSGIASPASRVLTGVFDLAAAITQQARTRINGQPSGVSTSIDAGGGVFGSYPLYVGKRGLNTSTMFNGRLYSLLIRGAATPDATIATVESYLNQKARVY